MHFVVIWWRIYKNVSYKERDYNMGNCLKYWLSNHFCYDIFLSNPMEEA